MKRYERDNPYIVILRVALIIFGLFSVGTRIILAYFRDPSIFHPYRFFTIQSNTLILGWSVFSIFWINREKYDRLTGIIKGALTTYISITMIVFIILIEPTYDPTGIDWFTSLFNHYVNPSLFILDFILTEEKEYQWLWPVYWLIYPLLYLVFTQIWGVLFDFYPYFFVNPSEVGVSGLFVWTLILTSIFFIFGVFYTWINRTLLIDK